MLVKRWALLTILLIPCGFAQRPRLSRKPPAAEELDLKTISITGVVAASEDKSLVVNAADHRILTFKITRETKKPANLELGDHVRVEATQDQEAFLTATSVAIDKGTTAKEAEQSDGPPKLTRTQPAPEVAAKSQPAPVVYKPAQPDPDDEGPPRLRHGAPNPPPARPLPADQPIATVATPGKETTVAVPIPQSEPEAEAPAALKPDAPLIDRAREWALSFTATLPNYVCQQFTTRYLKPPGQRDWQAKDIVSANVIYENGKEDYRNIAINGKSQTKKMEELPGSWSTGEFGTTLRSLFHPNRRTEFRYVKQAQITGFTTSVYDYSVKREYSDWRIQLGSQAVIPAYSGRVWVDQKTARVVRIEMQADEIPKDFPLDKVEASNDYGLIRLATADQYMLPLHAETLSCERGTTFCSRNAIEFRNYHKYSGEANITF